MTVEPVAYLSAFSPKDIEGAAPCERAKGLRSCASLFALGRSEVYQIRQEGSELVAVPKKTAEPSFLKTLVKAMALATLVLPLLCALGAVIYKKLNPIRIDKDKIAQNTFEQLIQKGSLQSLQTFLASPEFKRIPESGEKSIEWALMQLAVTQNTEAFKVLFQHEHTRSMMMNVECLNTIEKRIEEHFLDSSLDDPSDASEKMRFLFMDRFYELIAAKNTENSLNEQNEFWARLPSSSMIGNLLWVNGYICSVITARTLLSHLFNMAIVCNDFFIQHHGEGHLERIIDRLNNHSLSSEEEKEWLRNICYRCISQNDEVHVVLQALRASKHQALVREVEESCRWKA